MAIASPFVGASIGYFSPGRNHTQEELDEIYRIGGIFVEDEFDRAFKGAAIGLLLGATWPITIPATAVGYGISRVIFN